MSSSRAVSAGIVAAHGSRSNQDGLALGAQHVGVAARLGAGDPLARAVGHGDDAVEGARDLRHHVGTAGHAVPHVGRELRRDGVSFDADFDVDPRRLQQLHAPRPRRADPGRSFPRPRERLPPR